LIKNGPGGEHGRGVKKKGVKEKKKETAGTVAQSDDQKTMTQPVINSLFRRKIARTKAAPNGTSRPVQKGECKGTEARGKKKLAQTVRRRHRLKPQKRIRVLANQKGAGPTCTDRRGEGRTIPRSWGRRCPLVPTRKIYVSLMSGGMSKRRGVGSAVRRHRKKEN